MDRIAFAPEIDLPLSGLTLIAFVLHFNAWARGDSAETTVDLEARLPSARIRVAILFVGLVFGCWMTNIAVWAVFVLLLAVGAAVSLVVGGDLDGSGLFLLATGMVIREWSFGFPQLILQPPTDRQKKPESDHELLGARGTVVSPLRPSGDAEFDGRVVPVISESGQLLDVGTEIIVSGTRNGRICVRPDDTSSDHGD